jgi:hypothetical protein
MLQKLVPIPLNFEAFALIVGMLSLRDDVGTFKSFQLSFLPLTFLPPSFLPLSSSFPVITRNHLGILRDRNWPWTNAQSLTPVALAVMRQRRLV